MRPCLPRLEWTPGEPLQVITQSSWLRDNGISWPILVVHSGLTMPTVGFPKERNNVKMTKLDKCAWFLIISIHFILSQYYMIQESSDKIKRGLVSINDESLTWHSLSVFVETVEDYFPRPLTLFTKHPTIISPPTANITLWFTPNKQTNSFIIMAKKQT